MTKQELAAWRRRVNAAIREKDRIVDAIDEAMVELDIALRNAEYEASKDATYWRMWGKEKPDAHAR